MNLVETACDARYEKRQMSQRKTKHEYYVNGKKSVVTKRRRWIEDIAEWIADRDKDLRDK